MSVATKAEVVTAPKVSVGQLILWFIENSREHRLKPRPAIVERVSNAPLGRIDALLFNRGQTERKNGVRWVGDTSFLPEGHTDGSWDLLPRDKMLEQLLEGYASEGE